MLFAVQTATALDVIQQSLLLFLGLFPLQFGFQWVMNHHIRTMPDLLKLTLAQMSMICLGLTIGGLITLPLPDALARALLAFFFSWGMLMWKHDSQLDRGTIIATSAFPPLIFMSLSFAWSA